ncbi:MAG: FG-GAP repeat protein, partial [Bdellovibrionales bacterium]|nr:FG-GAP repeat protein [Bdellovibrionales bacterium]
WFGRNEVSQKIQAGDVGGYILASAPNESPSSSISVYDASGTLQRTFSLGTGTTSLGAAMAPVGDVNGDAYADFLIGAPGDDSAGNNAGKLYLVSGRYIKTGAEPKTIAERAGSVGEELGWSIVQVELSDSVLYAVGAPSASSRKGRVYLFDVSTGGFNEWKCWEGESNDFLGHALAAGDYDADGHEDLASGHPFYNANAGRVRVWSGINFVSSCGAAHCNCAALTPGMALIGDQTPLIPQADPAGPQSFGFAVAAVDLGRADGKKGLAASAPRKDIEYIDDDNNPQTRVDAGEFTVYSFKLGTQTWSPAGPLSRPFRRNSTEGSLYGWSLESGELLITNEEGNDELRPVLFVGAPTHKNMSHLMGGLVDAFLGDNQGYVGRMTAGIAGYYPGISDSERELEFGKSLHFGKVADPQDASAEISMLAVGAPAKNAPGQAGSLTAMGITPHTNTSVNEELGAKCIKTYTTQGGQTMPVPVPDIFVGPPPHNGAFPIAGKNVFVGISNGVPGSTITVWFGDQEMPDENGQRPQFEGCDLWASMTYQSPVTLTLDENGQGRIAAAHIPACFYGQVWLVQASYLHEQSGQVVTTKARRFSIERGSSC